MPDNDIFTAACNLTYSDAVYTNIVWGQVISEANPLDVLEDFATVVKTNFVDPLSEVQPLGSQWTSIVVRRLAPAISDVFVTNFTQAGNKLEARLPGTLFYLVRYYCEPYTPRSSYHWKVAGVGAGGNNAGNVTDEKITQFEPFISAMTGGPYTQNGNQFQFIEPSRAGTTPSGVRPVIRKMQIDGTIRNLRSRQVY